MNIQFWGLSASPFQLKMQAIADYYDYDWQRRPDHSNSVWSAWRDLVDLHRSKSRGDIHRYNGHGEWDEYPSVPFYRIDDGPWHYDSSAFAKHLDSLNTADESLLASSSPLLSMFVQLIDEAFDEFGLYMVHHMRWAGTARTTRMPEITAAEMRKIVPGVLSSRFRYALASRQSKRCAYLFSVAPEGFSLGVPIDQTPLSLDGFPETHNLLGSAWRRYLAAMEDILSVQPFLLGDRFTLADASAYGQLSMNLVDGEPAKRLKTLAPKTYGWLCDIRDGKHRRSRGKLYFAEELKPLLLLVADTFCSLMAQNDAAYEQLVTTGDLTVNEAAFQCGKGLYDGELLGFPFRAVAKSFQVRVWRDLLESFGSLSQQHQQLAKEFMSNQEIVDLTAKTKTTRIER